MSLQTRLAALITAIGADIKALQIAEPLSLGEGWMVAKDGASGFDSFGAATPTFSGTATSTNRALTTRQTRARRMEYLVTSAATTNVAGFRNGNPHLVRGNASGVGGFLSRHIWGPATGVSVSTGRGFCGLGTSVSAPTDVEPSSQTNVIGMGWDAADTNMQIMHNDGSGTCTKVDLGSSFPVPTSDRTSWYQVDIWCSANDTKFYWKVTDLSNNTSTSGDTGSSTDIPANTAYLAERGYVSVGGTSSVVGFALGGIYFKTEA